MHGLYMITVVLVKKNKKTGAQNERKRILTKVENMDVIENHTMTLGPD